MAKIISLFVLSVVCFSKLSIISFKEQLEYPGIQNGTTIVNYTIEIQNPKEHEIEIEGIWVKGRWIKFTQKTFSGNPIIIKASTNHVYSDTLKNKTTAPTRNKNDQGAVKYRLKGKEKINYIGAENIIRERALARP
ncbi:MAG: hypothetical protein CMP67_02525 [Flavobacteriales bacterium]|nr:hypothetical protein [Flavobacteriales bacterium]MBO72758.1 hypothetical protein [Flavobacteriales bacterium]|tara:strand:- start:2308 stop:2715 length:408 start_codon:yes stop_codon:yes gene_type:complete